MHSAALFLPLYFPEAAPLQRALSHRQDHSHQQDLRNLRLSILLYNISPFSSNWGRGFFENNVIKLRILVV